MGGNHTRVIYPILFVLFLNGAFAREYHVAVNGNNFAAGTVKAPLKNISAAAELALPGDVITVHEGIYRERIDPPRGGTSDKKRIVYRAAPGEEVIIKGSEKIKGWTKVENDTWMVSLPNRFFGDFNPYENVLNGDWLNNEHSFHTGAVYLDGHWLIETVTKGEVLAPYGKIPGWMRRSSNTYLMNIARFKPDSPDEKLAERSAAEFSETNNLRKVRSLQEGQALSFIKDGSFVKYEQIDFGKSSTSFFIRASSGNLGGLVEIRLDDPKSEVIGTVDVDFTGHWNSWKNFSTEISPVSGKHDVILTFKSKTMDQTRDSGLWYAEVEDSNTTIWAQFKGVDPNESDVEINVRKTVFYPSNPGMNFITVRGFKMMQAATPWAPPTAEQVGLIGAHWSKGWVIENNEISYSVCAGITLGKYGDEWDNLAESAEGYVETIKRALENGWNKETVGSHVVRNNLISHCEQVGICGSLGAIFSEVTNNTIHDIHLRSFFNGAEVGGIKFHGAVDSLIANNHIYRCSRGLWLDWMTQGTRVTGNLLHDNHAKDDIFVEVNHGPFLIDNNILLSKVALRDWSQGGAFVHNLTNGAIERRNKPIARLTPYLKPHDTAIVDLQKVNGGDWRFYNNIFIGSGLAGYDDARLPITVSGNVYLDSSAVSKEDQVGMVFSAFDPNLKYKVTESGTTLEFSLPEALIKYHPEIITGKMLGKPEIVDQPFTDYNGSKLIINTDYFSARRKASRLQAGPFVKLKSGQQVIKLRK